MAEITTLFYHVTQKHHLMMFANREHFTVLDTLQRTRLYSVSFHVYSAKKKKSGKTIIIIAERLLNENKALKATNPIMKTLEKKSGATP